MSRPPPTCKTGLVTSEYATGTVGAGAVGCALYLLAHSGFFQDLFRAWWTAIRIVTAPALPFPPGWS